MALKISKDLLDLFPNSNINFSFAELFTAEEALKTSDKSFLFIKQVISIAVSTVLFLRNALRDVVFHKFLCDENLNVYLLCPKKSKENRVALWTIDGLFEVFDVIKLKYVKTFTMYIAYRDGKNKAILELYSFNLNYEDGFKICLENNNTEMESISSADVNKLIGNTKGIIRGIIISCNTLLDKIPEGTDIKLSLHITYNGNQPSGFRIPGWTTNNERPSGIIKETIVFGNVTVANHHMMIESKVYEGETNFFKRLFNLK